MNNQCKHDGCKNGVVCDTETVHVSHLVSPFLHRAAESFRARTGVYPWELSPPREVP